MIMWLQLLTFISFRGKTLLFLQDTSMTGETLCPHHAGQWTFCKANLMLKVEMTREVKALHKNFHRCKCFLNNSG